MSLLALAACGDPLDRVEKLSDVTLAPDEPVVEALASPEELARKDGGLFNGLFRRAQPEPVAQNDPVAAAVSSANASLDSETETLEAPASSPDVADPVVQGAAGDAIVEDPAPRGGLFGLLRRVAGGQGTAPETVVVDEASVAAPDVDATRDAAALAAPVAEAPAPEAVVADARPTEVTPMVEPAPEVAQAATPEPVPQVDAAVAAVPVAEPDAEPALRRGLLRGLLGPRRQDTAQEADVAPAPDVEIASLEDAPTPPAPEARANPKPRGGLFARRAAAPRTGPDAADVSFGEVLPFGEIARVCDAKNAPLGRKLEKAGRGKGYALYDSAPESTSPRTFYVTGFSDGCPRQFTAALAMFGDPVMHEQLRYGRPSDKYPYSTTDMAYEKVKSALCKVPRRKPCGDKIGALEDTTVFISTYERFTDNGRWADILVHDGVVLAAALKDL